jgi:hypothetical protein
MNNNFDGFTFSKFSTVFDKSPPAETTIEETWREIIAGKYSQLINSIRQAPNKDERSRLKLKLPAITPQAHFLTGERSKTAPHNPRPVIVIDIDGLSFEDADRVRNDLGRDPHCFLSFLSPSAEGVKAFLAISDARKDPADIFYTAENYIKTQYGLDIDSKCIGPDRACFVSADGGAIYKGEAAPLKIVSRPQADPAKVPYSVEKPRNNDLTGESPLDSYSRQAGQQTFEALLAAHGWTPSSHDRLKWTRPGKSGGTSGQINPPDSTIDVWSFYSHSSSVDFETSKALTAGALYAELEFSGDFSAAAKSLRNKGFGDAIEPAKAKEVQLPPEKVVEIEPDSCPFPMEALPSNLRSYVKNVALVNGTPESLSAVICFSALSACLGNGVAVKSVPGSVAKPNLFTLTLAKSGTGKGRTQKAVMGPLLKCIQEFEENRQNSIAPIAEKKIAELSDQIDDVLEEGGDPGELNAEKSKLEKDLSPEYAVVSDATTETMLGYLGGNTHQACLSLSAEASQQLQNMSGRYSSSKGTNDDGTLCDLFSGDAVSYNRKNESHKLVDATLSICWMTQPHVFMGLLGDKNKIEGGFLARFLMHDSEAEIQDWPEFDPPIDAGSHRYWAKIIDDLFSNFRAKPVPGDVPVIPSTDEFRNEFRTYFNYNAEKARTAPVEQMAAFYNRYTENGFRLAIVLHASIWGADMVNHDMTGDTARRAIALVMWMAERGKDLLFPLMLEKMKQKETEEVKWLELIKDAGDEGVRLRTARRSANMTSAGFIKKVQSMPCIEIRKLIPDGGKRGVDMLFYVPQESDSCPS